MLRFRCTDVRTYNYALVTIGIPCLLSYTVFLNANKELQVCRARSSVVPNNSDEIWKESKASFQKGMET